MLERDRLIIRQHHAEVAAEAATEREARERPIREAQQQLQHTSSELAKVYIARLRGEVRDPDLFVSPEVATLRMAKSAVPNYVLGQWQLFVASHPDTYLCKESVDMFETYFSRNNLPIPNAEMFAQLAARFAEYSLLPERPAPVESVSDTEPESLPIAQGPELIDGWDLDSGEPRQWTPRELDRLSSRDYRKALRLYRDAFTLPTRGPGTLGLR